MTNCNSILKYGGMTHHLTYHRLKTQDTESRTVNLSGPLGRKEPDQGEDRGTSRAHIAQRLLLEGKGCTRVTSRGSRDATASPGGVSWPHGLAGPGAGGAAAAAGGAGSAAVGAAASGRRGRRAARCRTAGGSGVRAGADPGEEEGNGRVPRGEGGRAAGSPPAYLEIIGFP